MKLFLDAVCFVLYATLLGFGLLITGICMIELLTNELFCKLCVAYLVLGSFSKEWFLALAPVALLVAMYYE